MVEVRILGIGCTKSNELEGMCFTSDTESDIDVDIQMIIIPNKIFSYGVIHIIPSIINDELKNMCKLATKMTLLQLLKDYNK